MRQKKENPHLPTATEFLHPANRKYFFTLGWPYFLLVSDYRSLFLIVLTLC